MSRAIHQGNAPSQSERVAMARKLYEEWALQRGVDFAASEPAKLAACQSVLGRWKSDRFYSATKFTLFPNTLVTMPSLEFCFESSWDAWEHDWLMVGADLYNAIRKSKIALSGGRTIETESEPTAPAR
jgi:hypothetical protein